jgi:hypothetical protein
VRARTIIVTLGTVYLACCIVLAILLGEFALHPARTPIDKRPVAEAMAMRFGAILQDVSVISFDGTHLHPPGPVHGERCNPVSWNWR